MNENPEKKSGSHEAGKTEPITVNAAHDRVGANIAVNWVGYGINLLVGFLLAPVLLHKLGDIGFGIWALSLQLGGYMSVLDLGIRVAVTRYITHHHSRREREQIDVVITLGLLVLGLLGILCALAGLGIAYYLPGLIELPAEIVSAARWTVVLIGLGIAVTFPGALFTGALAAVSRYDLINLRSAGTVVARGLLIWFLLSAGYGLVAVAGVALLASCAGYAWEARLAWQVYGGFRLRLRRDQLIPTFRPLFTFSLFAFLLGISTRLLLWSDNVVVGVFLGPIAVTFYAIGGNLIDSLRNALQSVAAVFVPLATSFDARGDRAALRLLFLRGSRLTLLLILPAIFGFVALGEDFISLWMGTRYAELSSAVLTLLAIPVLFAPLMLTSHQILYGISRHKYNAYFSIAEAVANLGLSILLVHRMGLLGVAWGTVIPALVVEAVIVPCYTARQLDLRWSRCYWESWLQPVLASLPYAGLLLVFHSLGVSRTWWGLCTTLACGLPFYGAFVWFVALSSSEREMLVAHVRSTWQQASCSFSW